MRAKEEEKKILNGSLPFYPVLLILAKFYQVFSQCGDVARMCELEILRPGHEDLLRLLAAGSRVRLERNWHMNEWATYRSR
jgi:hypothetical protein